MPSAFNAVCSAKATSLSDWPAVTMCSLGRSPIWMVHFSPTAGVPDSFISAWVNSMSLLFALLRVVAVLVIVAASCRRCVSP